MSWRDRAVPVNAPANVAAEGLASDWRSRAKPIETTSPTPALAPETPPSPTQPQQNEAGYASSLGAGFNQLASGMGQLAAVYGLTDPDETADFVAGQNKAFQEVRTRYPENVRNQISEIENSDGFFSAIGNVITNPRGASHLVVEQLANSAPTLAGGWAGAVGGAQVGGLAGAGVGSIVPGPGTAAGGAVGSAVGGVTGGLGGAFAASVPVEIGAWVNQALSQRGIDVNDANALRKAYRDRAMMDEIRGEAERKGVTTAGVDAAFNLFAGRFLKGATGGKLPRRLVEGAKDVGVQATGEMASEGAGQVAAYKGDFSKVSGSDIALEGILTLPQSAAESVGGLMVRNRIDQNQQNVPQEPASNITFTQQPVAIPTPAAAAQATAAAPSIEATPVPPAAPVTPPVSVAGVPVTRDNLADLINSDVTAEEIRGDVTAPEAISGEPAAIKPGDIIEQVAENGAVVRGTVQQVVTIGDTQMYAVQNTPNDAPVFVDPADGAVNLLGQGQAFLPTEPAPATVPTATGRDQLADELAQPVENNNNTGVETAPQPVTPAPLTLKERLPTMGQDDLIALYQGKNVRDRQLAKDELERRFPGWNAPKAIDLASAASDVNQAPTEAQKEAGNYQKGHVRIGGLNISIENPRGGIRSGVDQFGQPWSVAMPDHYGYIRGTKGRDGDQVDVYIRNHNIRQGEALDPEYNLDVGGNIYIIDQVDPDTGKFDEHKVMMGYSSEQEALQAYTAAFSDGRGGERIGELSFITMPEFKKWLKSRNTKLPYMYIEQPAAPVETQPVAQDAPQNATTEAPVQPDYSFPTEGVTFQHGAGETFTAFDASKVDTAVSDHGPGVYLTDSPGIARFYARNRAITKYTKPNLTNEELEASGRDNGAIMSVTINPGVRVMDLEQMPDVLKAYQDKSLTADQLREMAQANGYGGIAYKSMSLNTYEGWGDISNDAREVLIFNPADVTVTKSEAVPQSAPVEAPAPEPVPTPPAQEPVPTTPAPQETATETPGADVQPTAPTETSTPRGKRLQDVGEKMAGKRAQDTQTLSEKAGAEAAKEIIKLTERSKVIPINLPEGASSGTQKYAEELRNMFPPFSKVFKEKFGETGRHRRWAKADSYEKQLNDLFIGDSDYDLSKQREVREFAVLYASVGQALGDALSTANNIAEAKQALLDILVDQDKRKDEFSYPTTAIGNDFERIMYFSSGSSYNAIRKLISDNYYPGSISDNEKPKVRTSVEKKLIRPSLEKVDRQGMKERRAEGEDVTPQKFMDTFGFRGVEFGNWVNSKEGQAHINHAYDALLDLSDRLGGSPKAISLGGKLGFAFGSRGSGEHAAHFEHMASGLENMVINLTKTKGDGSVAHEWAHALDHYLRQTGSGKMVDAVNRSLRTKLMTQDSLREHVMEFLRGYRYYEGLRREGPVGMARHFLRQVTPQRAFRGSTAFKEEADALGKNYWGLDKELFARAWESFIYDTLPGQSPYLVSGWVADGEVTKGNGYRGRPYPTGAERATFNELFQDFLDGIEFKESGPVAKSDYTMKAITAADDIAKAARELEEKLPELAKEVEDAKRSVQSPEVPNSVPPSDVGAGPINVPGTQGQGPVDGASQGDDRGSGADVQNDAGEGQGGAAGQRPGSGVSGSGDRVRGDDTVPSRADAEYAAQDVGDLPSYQGKGVNYVIPTGALDEKRSPRQKAKDNIRIIKLVKELERDGRAATVEEQELLAKFVGWGGAKDAFPNAKGEYKDGWKDIGNDLKSILTEEEYNTAIRTIQYAHYTSEVVVRAMWDGLKHFGFKGGAVFEPGMGVGHFLGMMPVEVSKQSTYAGIELDPMTARIARVLYPEASVRAVDFVRSPFPENMFDVVIGNPPFSEVKVKADPKYSDLGFSLHNYFFAKSLDMVAPGGILAFVTSRYTMDSTSREARAWMQEKADFLGAIRLPNTAFKTSANTEVVTDIVFLRKRLPGETLGGSNWLNTEEVAMTNADGTFARDENGKAVRISINTYFNDRPEMVLGNPALTSSQFRANDYTVDPVADRDLQAQLAEAVNRLPENIVTEIRREDQTGKDFTPTEDKEGSYYVKDGALMQLEDGIGVPVKLRGAGVEGGMTKGDIAKIRDLIPVRNALRSTMDAMVSRDDRAMKSAQTELTKAYDAFVKKYGPITKVEIDERRPSAVQMEGLRNDMRDDFAEAGMEFDEGDINLYSLVDAKNPATGKKYSAYEIAAIRAQRRQEIEAEGKQVYEGSFNPDDQPATITEKYPNLDVFKADPEYYNLMILEHYDPATGTAAKQPVFERNIMAEVKKPAIATAADALNYSLATTNRVDVELMSQEYGKSADAIMEELEALNLVYKVPGYNGDGQPTADIWYTADEYLTGKVKLKLAHAQQLAKINPYYQKNVEALEAVQPEDIPVSEISTNLGSPYFSPKVVEDFAKSALGLTASVRHSRTGNIWTVSIYNNYDTNNTFKWGTSRMTAGTVLENLLSKRTIAVYDKVEVDGKETRILNTDETEAAREKGRLIQEAFDGWVWKSEHADTVHKFYNDNFNDVVARKFDGSHLTPAMSPEIRLRKHQKDFIWRVLQSGNAYAAHAVGAGKTLEMVGVGMEMRRLGVWRKPMYVVPNHMLAQFSAEFRAAYPQAKIYVADEYRFHTNRRKKFVAQVAKSDWDAVVITYSAFKKVPISQQFEAAMIRNEIDRYMEAYKDAGGSPDDFDANGKANRFGRRRDPSQTRLQKQIERLNEKLSKLKNRSADQSFTFEQLGVDALLVDEAHTFRKLSFPTLQGNLRGVDPNGSKAAWDLYMKSKFLDTLHPGKSLVLASGTPLTNTVGEVFTIQRYMNERQLTERGIDNFDAWASTFATSVTNLEKQPSGKYANVTRLARFQNLQSLSMMVREFMDVVTSKELGTLVERPNMKSGQIIIRTTQPTREFKSYQKFLEHRMQLIQERSGPPQPGDDIILKVINDGRHAAIDMRLIDPTLPEQPSKLEDMIARSFDIYQATADREYKDARGKVQPVKGGTQIIFSDLGIKVREKDGKRFSAYSQIKKKLVELGVPADQIAFMRDFEGHDEKRRLFKKVNDGEVRFLIGSTGNMGTGVNVQRRLVAIHNLDAPWLPADLEQRIGRGLRQGNQNKEIEVYGYGTEGSYDSTMWGILETKANAVTQFLSGETKINEMDDIEDTDSYRLAKALTSGDPRVLEQASLIQDITKLQRKSNGFIDEQARSRREIGSKKQAISLYKDRIAKLTDEVLPKRKDVKGDNFMMMVSGKPFTDRAEAGTAILTAANQIASNPAGMTGDGVKIGEFGGFDLRLFYDDRVRKDIPFSLFIDAPYLTTEEYNWGNASVSRPFSAVGMASRLTNVLEGVESEITRTRAQMESAERAITQLEAGLSDTFPQQAELNAKTEQLAKLEADLQANAVQEVVDETYPIEYWESAQAQQSSKFRIVDTEEVELRSRSASRKPVSDGSRQKIERAIAAQLKKVGWPDLNVVVTPEVTNPDSEQQIAGAYWNKVIYLSMQNDPISTLNHELIHVLREVGAFTPGEWRQLEARAAEWRSKYGIDAKYKPLGLSETEMNEEGIASAFQDYTNQGIVRRLANRILRFLSAIKAALTGGELKFTSAEDVFDAILSGKVAPRRASTEREQRVRFAVNPSTDPDTALTEAMESIDEQIAARVRGFDRELPVDLGRFANTLAHPHHIASLHEDFSPVYLEAVSQFEMRDQIVHELSNYVEDYNRLSAESKEKVNSVLELGRLVGKTWFPESDKTITVENKDQPDAIFTKVGEKVTLNEWEATVYLRVRRAMDKALDIYIEQILDDYGFLDQGINTRAKLEKALLAEKSDKMRERMGVAIKMIKEIEEAKRKGYVPFKRWGNVGILVKKVDAATDESEWTVEHYEQVDVTGPLDRAARTVQRFTGKDFRKLGNQPQVKQALERLNEKYPEGEYEIITFPVGKAADLEGKVNIRDLDVLAASSELSSEEYAGFREAIEDSLKRRGFKQHFYKARNVPGYSADFERAVNDYVVGIAGHLARRRHAPRLDKKIEILAAKKVKPRLLKYAQKYASYIQNPQDEFQNMRQAAFFYYISGSLASAMTNLTQVPLVTAPWLKAMVSHKEVATQLGSAYKDVAGSLAFPRTGLEVFDPKKLPADVRGAMEEAWASGYFVPLNTYEAMGIANTNVAALRGLGRRARETMNWVSIKFSTAERINRMATYMAAYRIAKDPANRQAILRFIRNDALARAEVMKGDDARFANRFAEYAVMSTQLRMGRLNRPTLFRGVGTLVFQFQSFAWQILELMARLGTIHGSKGREALGYILLALILSSGIYGLPFADDLKDFFEAAYKRLTRRDIDVETETRALIAKFFGPTIAQAVVRGVPRVLLDVDMSGRVGFGNITPDSFEDFLGVWWDMLYKRPERVATSMARDDYSLAFADAMPNFVGNFIKGVEMMTEGVKSVATGDTIIAPEDIKWGDAFRKMVGFTSGSVANERERNWAIKRASRAADDLRADYYDRIARTIARQARANNKGDAALANQYNQELQGIYDELQRYNEHTPLYKQVIIRPQTLRQRVKEEMMGDKVNKPRKQAASRAEEITGIYGGAK